MARLGTVNYHVHKPAKQAFHIDADGIVGNLISPELATTQISLTDLRSGAEKVSFTDDGMAFANAPSQVRDFLNGENWQQIYDRELSEFLIDQLGAREVVIFDHTVRVDDPEADRKPARNVHSDYSQEGADKRLIDILGPESAAEWSRGRFGFVNVWRPLENPINSAPLGFVRPSTVAAQDWIQLDLIYPNRRGQIMGLAHNERHQWIYQSNMTPDEIVYFNIYDNQGLPSVGHSAIDLVEDASQSTIRKSIESRTLVRY